MFIKSFQRSVKLSTGLPQCFLIAVLLLVTLNSCNNGGESKPDVSKVEVKLNSRRFDHDMAAIDTNHIGAGLQALSTKYPDFLNFYLDTLMGLGIQGNFSDSNPGIQKGMRTFLTYKDYRDLFDTINKHFPDTKELDEQLAGGFKYAKHYFPAFKEPKVIYITSLLNKYGAFTYGDILGIGLDMFLGASYPYYKSVGIPEYMAEKLEPENIPVAAFRAIYEDVMPFQPDNRTLLDMMIQRGKEMYYVSKVLPDLPEEQLLSYTKEQQEWCVKNEALIYNFFISKNFLYSTNWQEILRYVSDAPESTGLPGSPGNVGTFTGLQIVKAYMKEHPQMTLQQLVQDKTDPQRFLQESKYKPK